MAPAGITGVLVELWGGGGGSGCHTDSADTGNNFTRASGGGGRAGGCVRVAVPVIPGNTYVVNVGTGGQDGCEAQAGGTTSLTGEGSVTAAALGGQPGKNAVHCLSGSSCSVFEGAGSEGAEGSGPGAIVRRGGNGFYGNTDFCQARVTCWVFPGTGGASVQADIFSAGAGSSGFSGVPGFAYVSW